VGQTFHSFYMIFARAESGKVGSLVVDRANAIVRADWWRPANPAERGTDMLLDVVGARHMAKYLRAGWKVEEEFGARDKCLGSGHWPGRLCAVNPIREPGWTAWRCEDRYVQGGNRLESDV
jgi:hypothetical protein